MSDLKYHIKPGDLLHNPNNGVFGVVIRLTRKYVYFYMLGKDVDEDYGLTSGTPQKAEKNEVYYNIDNRHIFVYYGSTRRRRKRPTVDVDNSLFHTI